MNTSISLHWYLLPGTRTLTSWCDFIVKNTCCQIFSIKCKYLCVIFIFCMFVISVTVVSVLCYFLFLYMCLCMVLCRISVFLIRNRYIQNSLLFWLILIQEFHGKYYHPSNARIWFYGDDDPTERLRILSGTASKFHLCW